MLQWWRVTFGIAMIATCMVVAVVGVYEIDRKKEAENQKPNKLQIFLRKHTMFISEMLRTEHGAICALDFFVLHAVLLISGLSLLPNKDQASCLPLITACALLLFENGVLAFHTAFAQRTLFIAAFVYLISLHFCSIVLLIYLPSTCNAIICAALFGARIWSVLIGVVWRNGSNHVLLSPSAVPPLYDETDEDDDDKHM
jgi:hypothetical protein